MKTELELFNMTAQQRYYWRHRDKQLARVANYKKKNFKKISKKQKEYRIANIDKCRAYDKLRYHNNKESEIARRTEWRNRNEINKNKDRAAVRRNNSKIPVKIRTEQTRQWRIKNPERAEEHRVRTLLKKHYNITFEQYSDMLKKQNNKCAICDLAFGIGHQDRACVDHCHNTGRVRGIVHRSCNSMIGFAKDIPTNLIMGARYLERNT